MTITEGEAHIPVEAVAEAMIVTKSRHVKVSALRTRAAQFIDWLLKNQRIGHGVAVKGCHSVRIEKFTYWVTVRFTALGRVHL